MSHGACINHGPFTGDRCPACLAVERLAAVEREIAELRTANPKRLIEVVQPVSQADVVRAVCDRIERAMTGEAK